MRNAVIDEIEELKALITCNLDVVELLDVLGLSFSELVDILEEQIEDKAQECFRACR